MKSIENCFFRAAELLLCLVMCCLLSCSSLKKLDESGERRALGQVLQVAICESDLSVFLQKVQLRNLTVFDVRPGIASQENSEATEIWITFRFVSNAGLSTGSSEVMSTGLVKRILINN